ncbi:FBP C-terminal treble-clef zinc-finger [Klenkia marina]|uniref:FBP C-terminal treble-clef zinc-finger n=1 Tax=Klenkia marina TaxID=1960309 RepID=A0A1G4XUG4_9ACTN|nr:FBP domain-containing protein [Klenkia marina]SCX44854.1 FBP C-terminal treble-clef zinc-finger [Klenkia marina]
MHALTEKQIRSSFVNASRREVADAVLPDLATQPWEHLEMLGWRDPKAPLRAYVVLELDRGPVGILLRAPEPGGRRKKAMCAWCRDLLTVRAGLFVARRGGASGRAGNTLGVLLCDDLSCSTNVRRPPTSSEAGDGIEAIADQVVAERIEALRARSAAFAAQVVGE